MDIVLTPQLLKYANIPGLVDMVIGKEPDARKDDLGLRKKIQSQGPNLHKRATTSYQTNASIRGAYGTQTPDLAPNP